MLLSSASSSRNKNKPQQAALSQFHKTLTTFYQTGNFPHKLQVNRFAKCFVQPPDKQTSTSFLERNHDGINDDPINVKSQSRHENTQALVSKLKKMAIGGCIGTVPLKNFKANSEVEQRVIFAKQAKLKRRDSNKQFDYEKEKMVPVAVTQGVPIPTSDLFNQSKEALRKAHNLSATLGSTQKREENDALVAS